MSYIVIISQTMLQWIHTQNLFVVTVLGPKNPTKIKIKKEK